MDSPQALSVKKDNEGVQSGVNRKPCRECWLEDPLYSLQFNPDTPPEVVRSVYCELVPLFTEVVQEKKELLIYTEMRARHVVMLIQNVCDTLTVPAPWKLYRTHGHCADELLKEMTQS